MNTDIMIGNFSEKDSEQKESEEKHSEPEEPVEQEEDETSQAEARSEYSRQRIQEITPKISTIMYAGASGNKQFDKIEASLFEKIFNSFKKKCKYDDIVKILNLYSEGVIGADELNELIQDHFPVNSDLRDQFLNLIYSRENNRRQLSWFTKPISEFSLSDCAIIDKSYTSFPSDFHKLICSGMEFIEQECLNSKYVSVPRGSEYFSFHLRNSSEEQLFLVEDERYEMDSYLGMTESTINALQKLKNHHQNLDESERASLTGEKIIELRDKYVKKPQLKWIRHIYNCTDEDTKTDPRYNFLNLHNSVVFDIILERLTKNHRNWSEQKKDRQK